MTLPDVDQHVPEMIAGDRVKEYHSELQIIGQHSDHDLDADDSWYEEFSNDTLEKARESKKENFSWGE
ncbi:hypothetical protein JTE90_000189, partial [Oedothorax gibbosus]